MPPASYFWRHKNSKKAFFT